MGQFEVYSSFPGDFTLISNRFLEDYMPKANGEFVKIYLYLLGRCQSGKTKMELSSIADTFNCTETDILRALRYWKESGIMDVSFDQAGNVQRFVLRFLSRSCLRMRQNLPLLQSPGTNSRI